MKKLRYIYINFKLKKKFNIVETIFYININI